MSKRERHQKKIEIQQRTRVSNEVKVEMLSDTTGVRFIVHFSIEIPPGKNNFNEMTEVVDNEINVARYDIIKKIANKLGVEVAFTN